jgi:ribosomal protein S18 acetylase RimI-like enzyme
VPVAGILGWVDEAENETLGIRRGYLERIWTLRDYRGRGIASALVAHALEAYRAAGLAIGHLSVDADNPSHAGTMYERMGFRITDGLVMLRRPAG